MAIKKQHTARERTPSSAKPRKRQTWRPGAVLAVPLGDGRTAFGQVVNATEIVFFDFSNSRDLDLAEVSKAPVAFRVPVMRRAVTSGAFNIIGHVQIPEVRSAHGEYFRQDPDTGDLFISADGGVTERRATLAEAAALECAAVWSAEHVVDRLRDHFDGRPNEWVESLRPRHPRSR